MELGKSGILFSDRGNKFEDLWRPLAALAAKLSQNDGAEVTIVSFS